MNRTKIVLGTAQLGMPYGITNTKGQLSIQDAALTIDLAIKNNVPLVDTASSYGNAECILGRILSKRSGKGPEICTKLSSMAGVDEKDLESVIRKSVHKSLDQLRKKKIDILMFHSFSDIIKHDGLALDVLYKISREGLCENIGVSVYTPEQAVIVMTEKRISHIQIPFNFLDQRWLSQEFMFALANRPDITVHARSIFLQGLLLNSSDRWPEWCADRFEISDKIDGVIKKCGRIDRLDLCLAFALSFPWIKYIIVGVETPEQFNKILNYSKYSNLTEAELIHVKNVFSGVSERLINPTKW